MKSRVRLLSMSCAVAVLTAAMGSSSAYAAVGGVSCVVPNLWKAEPQANFSRIEYSQSVFDMDTAELSASVAQQVRAHQRLLLNAGYPVEIDAAYEAEVTPARSWSVTYQGAGLGQLKGATRARVARAGSLWTVRPAAIGVGSNRAAAALSAAGAKNVRAWRNGALIFRAPRSKAQAIATAAAVRLGRKSPAAAYKRNAAYGGPAAISYGLRSEVAMLRLEGRSAQSATSFIEQLPSGSMTVYPFGTSFLVHVQPSDLEALRDYLQEQGNSVVLVGASGPLVSGRGIGSVIRSCGANVLADRFPTPPVYSASADQASVNVDGQYVSMSAGEIALVVQQPTWGQGLEVAFIRFMR